MVNTFHKYNIGYFLWLISVIFISHKQNKVKLYTIMEFSLPISGNTTVYVRKQPGVKPVVVYTLFFAYV